MGEMKINISDNLADQRTRALIARYDLVDVTRCGEGWREMQRDDQYGDWVSYEDHIATLADERRRALEEVAARIIDTHRMGDRDAWLDLARLIRAKAHAGQEG